MGRTACTEPQCLYSTAIPLLPLWAVRPVQSLSACTIQLYLYSPYAPYGLYRASVPVQGCTLPFSFFYKFCCPLEVVGHVICHAQGFQFLCKLSCIVPFVIRLLALQYYHQYYQYYHHHHTHSRLQTFCQHQSWLLWDDHTSRSLLIRI